MHVHAARKGERGGTPARHRVEVGDLPPIVVVAGLAAVAANSQANGAARAPLSGDALQQLSDRIPTGLGVERDRVLHCSIRDGVLDATAFDHWNAGGEPLADAVVSELRWARSEGLLEPTAGLDDVVTMAGDLAFQELERMAPACACRVAVADRRGATTLRKIRFFGVIDLFDSRSELTPGQCGEVVERAEEDLRILQLAWVRADQRVRTGIDPSSAFGAEVAWIAEQIRNRLPTANPTWSERDVEVLETASGHLLRWMARSDKGSSDVAWVGFAAELAEIAADGICRSIIAVRPAASGEPGHRFGS